MKKALILAIVVVLGLGVATFANTGVYFSLEHRGSVLELAPELTFGVDFEAPLGAGIASDILSGDFYTVIPNIFAEYNLETPWEFGATIGVQLKDFDCDFETYFALDPTGWPATLEIVEPSVLSLTLTGKPGSLVEVWGGVELAYDEEVKSGSGKHPDQWLFGPVFGVKVRIEF